jgi:hypothetical protein
MELLPERVVGDIPVRSTQVTARFRFGLSMRRVDDKLKRIGHSLSDSCPVECRER